MRTEELDLTEDIMKAYPEEAHGPSLIMHSIVLEAWRRGIKVKFLTAYVKNQIKIRYVLSYKGEEFRFQLSLGDKVSREARRIGKSKELTKTHLSEAGVSVPEGKVINVQDADYTEVISYADQLGYPVIIKPAHASLAIGVRTNIHDVDGLTSALEHVHSELGYNDIIIERHARGSDTRSYVVDGKVIGAFKRVPASIVGDEKSSIKELIEKKNRYRSINPHLSHNLIEINDDLISYISNQGYDLDVVLKKGEKVYLSDSTFAKDNSETVDITDEITEDFKETAVNAVKHIPGMELAGVDIMMDQEKDQNYVLEVNCRPNIGGHLFPVQGESRDVPKAIIDYYFPKTASIEKGINEYFTYDFESIVNFLRKGIVKEVTLPPLPKKNVINKHLIVTGDAEPFKNRLFKSAVGHRLGGHLQKLGHQKYKLVVAGPSKRVGSYLEMLMKLPKIKVEITDENKWDTLLMYKFKIMDEMRGQSSKSQYSYEKDNIKLIKENERLKKEIAKLKESTSWKVTEPLRKIGKVRKNNQN